MQNTFSSRVEAAAFRALLALPTPLMRRLAGPPVILDGQVLDLETQWMLRLQALRREPPVETLSMTKARAGLVRQCRLAGGRQPVGAVRDLEVPGGAGPIGARLYVPHALVGPGTGPSPLLFFVHGGGMMYGDLDSHDAVCRLLAERAGIRVLAVDYRLAPEHPFPAAVDDCWTAYQWVAEHAGELGADPERLGVGGDSAGGYLSAVVALRAAAAGVPLKHQLLVYPVADMGGGTESRRMFGEGFFLTTEFIDLADRSYLTPEHDRRDPDVSVLHVEKVPENLAPASVVTAGFDPLRDEGEAYASLLAQHGVTVDLKRYPGFIHGFFNVVGVGSSSRAAVAEIAAKLRAALH
ncbi:MAG: alpha/beta hydrolase [Nocardioidaceae bacterium]